MKSPVIQHTDSIDRADPDPVSVLLNIKDIVQGRDVHIFHLFRILCQIAVIESVIRSSDKQHPGFLLVRLYTGDLLVTDLCVVHIFHQFAASKCEVFLLIRDTVNQAVASRTKLLNVCFGNPGIIYRCQVHIRIDH